ncbi:MAG: argininosuccinate lyase [Planctomycetota bacterium]
MSAAHGDLGDAADRALWSGRFAEEPAELFRAANDSLPVDWRLVAQDIRGSRAWAAALHSVGVLNADELNRILDGLDEILAVTRDHGVRPPIESGAEDVHTWVEWELTARVGDLGKKLHTGRSRNDQVATDLRLWTMETLDDRVREARMAQRALCELARRAGSTAVPSYTHLQRAQPVLFAHWCLAYVEMLDRDTARLEHARSAAAVCPLGSAALAGTTYAIDRERLARELGFDGVSGNSLDAVSDRDFVLDALSASAVCGVHLSRLAEDLIVYASSEFGFVQLGDAVSSGSSLMPQKKNPDSLELLRGKAGRLSGAFANVLITCKALPLAYNKDLQEDKAALFDAMDQLSLLLRLTALTVRHTHLNEDRCNAAARTGYLNATEAADHLVAAGVPFRTAHEQVGAMVREAIGAGVELHELPMDRVRAHAPDAGPCWSDDLSLAASLARRDVVGGTAPKRVAAALGDWEGRLVADGGGGV